MAEILVASGQAVAVPPAFVGTHLSLHTPAWKPGGGGSIPAPAYPYGYVRTVSAEVGGLSERGFWSNIETAPGLYDWQYMDQWMAATAGHPVIWTVYGTPTFYQLYPGEPSRWPSWPGIASPPTTSGHQALTRYVSAVMARYSTRIAAIEVWNEPTLPWTGGVTSYDDRWSQSWGLANRPSMPMPFFSGSASDLANIAFSVRRANPGVPVIGAAFVDKWSPDKNTVERFMNAPVTLAGGSGRGGDQVDAMSVHFYDYSRRPLDMLDTLRGYRSKLAASAWPNLPIWVTEVGAEDGGRFTANEPAAGTAIVRWSVLAAALKTRSIVLYGHISAPNREQYLGDPVYGSNTIAALRDAARLNGATICEAAVLGDGRVWANLAGGTTLLR
ncbi:MAG: hypothetical protein R3E87_22145 [Burkholderiaceae bacterium]